MKASLSLILPIYNSAAFLEESLSSCWDWLAGLERETELLLVDDGSTDATPEILREFAERMCGQSGPRILLCRNEPNMGKGFAVRRGMLSATGDLRIFTDADLTYPIENAEVLIAELENGAALAIGSRMHPESRYIVAPDFLRYVYTRHTIGRVFNLLVRMVLLPGILDTQAGLKGFTAAASDQVIPRGDRHRFSFDVELLFIARQLGLSVAQCPVRFIYRKEPSTVHFFRDTLLMVWDMTLVRLRGWSGRYRRPVSPDQVLSHPACQDRAPRS